MAQLLLTQTKVGYLHVASWFICAGPGLMLILISDGSIAKRLKKKKKDAVELLMSNFIHTNVYASQVIITRI